MAYKTSDFYALLMETSARFIHAREMAEKFGFFFSRSGNCQEIMSEKNVILQKYPGNVTKFYISC